MRINALAAALLASLTAFPALSAPLSLQDVRRAFTAFQEPAAQCLGNCHMSPIGYAMVKHFESLSISPKPDPLGIPTVCHGHVVLKGEVWDRPCIGDLADQTLRADMAKHEKVVDRVVKVPLWPLQADALISFEFNTGPGKCRVKDGFVTLKKCRPSSLLLAVNAGQHDQVPDLLMQWTSGLDRSGKRIKLLGLELRREAEGALYELQKP